MILEYQLEKRIAERVPLRHRQRAWWAAIAVLRQQGCGALGCYWPVADEQEAEDKEHLSTGNCPSDHHSVPPIHWYVALLAPALPRLADPESEPRARRHRHVVPLRPASLS